MTESLSHFLDTALGVMTEPSWLEQGQLWIDTTDNSIKIKPEVHS